MTPYQISRQCGLTQLEVVFFYFGQKYNVLMTFIQGQDAKKKRKETKEIRQNSNETHNHSRPALPKKNFCDVEHNTID